MMIALILFTGLTPFSESGLGLTPIFRNVSFPAKNLLVLIPPYEFPEKEFTTVFESLRRYGNLTIASADTTLATGDSVMSVRPDVSIYNIDTLKYDILIIIGGVGSLYWADDKKLVPILTHFARKGIVSFGLSVIALARAGLLRNKMATTIRERMAIKELKENGVRYQDRGVIQDGNIITARSPSPDFFKRLSRLITGE